LESRDPTLCEGSPQIPQNDLPLVFKRKQAGYVERIESKISRWYPAQILFTNALTCAGGMVRQRHTTREADLPRVLLSLLDDFPSNRFMLERKHGVDLKRTVAWAYLTEPVRVPAQTTKAFQHVARNVYPTIANRSNGRA